MYLCCICSVGALNLVCSSTCHQLFSRPKSFQQSCSLREFVVNSRHPGPRRVWKVGAGARWRPPLPLDPVDPLDPLDPLESSVRLIFVRRRGKIEHLSRDDPPPGSPGGSGQPRVSPVRPWASFGRVWDSSGRVWDSSGWVWGGSRRQKSIKNRPKSTKIRKQI